MTYNCPSAEWALRKHLDFASQGLTDITITGPDALPMTLAALEALVADGIVPQPCAPVQRQKADL